MKGNETHPAYGLAVLTKTSGGAQWLFGSRVEHGSTVHLTIHNASQKRHLGQDWRHCEDIVVDLEMSAAQWATLVSSFGNGSGTPVTLRYKRTGKLEACGAIPPYHSTLSQHTSELHDTLKEAVEIKDTLLAGFDSVVEAPGKRNIATFRRSLQTSLENLLSKFPFIVKQFGREMHNLENDAKVEVEAFVSNAVRDLGLAAIVERQKELTSPPEGEALSGYGLIPEGKRHAELVKLGRLMRKNGVDYDAIVTSLKKTNEERCQPPLSETEVANVTYQISLEASHAE